MLVLSRKLQESIVVDGTIKITVVQIKGNKIRLGIEAPPEVNIVRSELLEKAGERSFQVNETGQFVPG